MHKNFWRELDQRIAKFDLLCHPFYKAWSAGELTGEELSNYAANYYHHVAAFPEYLRAFHARLAPGMLAGAVLANQQDEDGVGSPDGRSHAELWLDFAEAMGARRGAVCRSAPLAEVRELIASFERMAREGEPIEALAAFYAYESQVPRVAKEKARGLRDLYAADSRATKYFDLHTTADVHHSQVWREQMEQQLSANPESAQRALGSAEQAAKALWRALDGIERERLARRAA